MLPDGWKATTIGSILPDSYRNGIYKESKYYGDGTSIIRINDFDTNGKLTTIQLNRLQLTPSEAKDYRVDHLDILVNRVNSLSHIGKSLLWQDTGEPTVYESNMMRIKACPEKIAPSFLILLLQNEKSRKHFQAHAKKAVAQASINQQDVKALHVLLPPVEEQKKIAAILGDWDQAIGKLEQLLAAKRTYKRGLMQHLLSGKMRFPEFSDEWQHLHANEIFKPVSSKNNGDEDLLAVTQDQGVIPRHQLDRKVVMPEGSTAGYKLVEPGNFIISLRSFQGGLEYSRFRGLVSPAYTVLKSVKEIDEDFYRYYFKSYDFIGHLAVAVIGIRDGKQISYEDFSFLKLPYPALDEQRRIAAVLAAADAEIAALERQLEAFRQQKHGLMQQLLTGKTRVKVEG